MLMVTKEFSFCYGHFLPNYDGDCVNQHGHNTKLRVTIGSRVEKERGMVIDFKELKKIVEKEVISVLDHKNINSLVNPYNENDPYGHILLHTSFELMKKFPTVENIVCWIVLVLQEYFGDKLVKVQMSETDTSWCTWKNIKN